MYQYDEVNWENGANRIFKIDVRTLLGPSYESNHYLIVNVADNWEQPDHRSIDTTKKEAGNGIGIIVLGKKILPNGQPSPVLIGRMNQACALYHHYAATNKNVFLILSGGRVEKADKAASEAWVMRHLALSHTTSPTHALAPVPETQLILEDKALNSIENIINCQVILEDHGIRHAILVTSDFHMPRSLRITQYVLNRPLMHYYDGEFPIGMLYNVETCEDKAAEMTATERLQEEEV